MANLVRLCVTLLEILQKLAEVRWVGWNFPSNKQGVTKISQTELFVKMHGSLLSVRCRLSLFFWPVPSSSCLYYFCLLNTVLTHHSTRFILNLRYKLFTCIRNSTTSFLKNSHLKYQRRPLYIWCSSTYSMIVLIFLVSSNASFASIPLGGPAT